MNLQKKLLKNLYFSYSFVTGDVLYGTGKSETITKCGFKNLSYIVTDRGFKTMSACDDYMKESGRTKLYSANNILVDMNFVKSEAETAIDTNLAINFYIMEFPLISLLKFLKDKLILKDYLLHIV